MKTSKMWLALLFILVAARASSQQKKDSTWIGSASGIARDSAHNYALQAATVAIYNAKDSSLVSYQLCNNFGEFQFTAIPLGTPLKIVVSYVGYKSKAKYFIIPIHTKAIDLKEINLERSEDNELEEVVVRSVPPVRMNGDTLEFNADAFKLDKNAVGEDLLRNLPGVTIWGDGTITVNGKQVSMVLVEGKPFFGGDTRVATQNIPKTAISKIQVYQQNQNRDNPLDSITQINIKLKKDKNFGHFGKVFAGYGTDKRYEGDANINFFNKKTQLGIVGASNNTNKIANDATTLMRNSTYKGVGASIEYQPSFRTQGTNQPNSGGFIFQQDFIPNPDYNNNDRLTANYFIKNNTNTVTRNTQTITALSTDSSQTKQNSSQNMSGNTAQTFNAAYNKHKGEITLHASTGLSMNNDNNASNSKISSYGTDGNLQSTSNADNNGTNDDKNLSLHLALARQKSLFVQNRLPGNWEADYSLNAGDNHSLHTSKTTFNSLADPTQNQNFDRLYNNNTSTTQHHLFLSLDDFSPLLFGYTAFLSSVTTKLQNSLDVNIQTSDNTVKNRDIVTDMYVTNTYLTNSGKLTVLNDQPALVLGKIYRKGLANRYTKLLSNNFNAQVQLYYQKNTSYNHAFQNFDRHYQKFLPDGAISYSNDQFGDFKEEFNLSYTSSANYPTVGQLYPLVDSSNLYNIQQGNPILKESIGRGLSFSFKHTSVRMKNTFNYNMNVSAGITHDDFTDSSYTDNLGRTTHYTVNKDGNRYLNISGALNKAFKFKNNQLQISFSLSLNFNRDPSNVNGIWYFSRNFSNNNILNLYYTYSDWLAINLGENYSFYHSKQTGLNNNEFRNSTQSTTLSTSINCTKKFGISSNVVYNHATSTGSTATDFTIWNANVAYRFLSGNNLELKLAALDLLHQNTSVINYGNNNSLTHGTANVLQQYFMITLSYFPRKFG
jgi:hypothetical protein